MPTTNFPGGIDTTGLNTTGASNDGNITTTTLTTGSITVTGNSSTTGYNLDSVATDLTAAGTTITDALQLAAQVNNVTTTAASTGVKLPTGVIGMTVRIFNSGASTLAIYAKNSETINGTAGATGITLATTKVTDLTFVKSLTWISVALN
jgi:hypothetical protein